MGTKLKKLKKQDWILWNSEVSSICGIGSEEEMKERARNLNNDLHTDAYRAIEFNPDNER